MGAFLNGAAGLSVFLGFLDLRALSTGGSIVLVYNPGYWGAFLASASESIRKLDDDCNRVNGDEAGMLLLAGRRGTMDNQSYHDEIWVRTYRGKTDE